jgi:hypothetical protein
MSRYCAEHNTKPILTASEIWKERCLVKQLSVFTEHPLWINEHVAELEQYFVNNLDEGEGDFFDKLGAQLYPTSPGAKQLTAEMQWLMLLLRKAAERTIDKLWQSLGEILDQVHAEECLNFFRNSGYVSNQ